MPVMYSPTSSITPDTSLPLMCGSLTPGSPLRVQRSRWFSAQALTRISTWSLRRTGSGTSSNFRTSGPPNSWKHMAFIVASQETFEVTIISGEECSRQAQSRYNRRVLKTFRPILVIAVVLCAVMSFAQAPQTLLVLPFENTSKATGLEWISEAFPEVIDEGMSSRGIYVVTRDDRNYAFDRMGVPQST